MPERHATDGLGFGQRQLDWHAGGTRDRVVELLHASGERRHGVRVGRADHVALDNALAGSSSSSLVTFGIVAVRAGSKNACAPTTIAMTTYAIQT